MREGNSKIDKIYSTARSISTGSIYRLSQRRKGAQKDLEMALDSMEADRIASQLVQRTKAWIAELSGGEVDDDDINISGHSGSKLSEARTWKSFQQSGRILQLGLPLLAMANLVGIRLK